MKRLIWKLLGINLLIIGCVITIVWLAVDYLAADYFVILMDKYNISPTASHRMFINAVHRYIIWASLSALILAVTFSFLLMRRVLDPLTKMTRITKSIASGDYSMKAPIRSLDEVGQLAMAFNQMADKLKDIEQLRKTLMIDVAHELRTPLTNMQGYLEALIDGVVAPSGETFKLLQNETLRLVHLVEDILRLTRADTAKMDLHKFDIQIDELINQVLASFRSQFTARDIQVETNLKNGGNRVKGDPNKLIQVIQNLLQNSVQYTRQGGKVRIYTDRLPGEIKIIFANTGGELAENDLPFIFERFYRGEKSRSREYGGSGIGLAIVKELVKAHDGQIGAEIINGETQIWFTLPDTYRRKV